MPKQYLTTPDPSVTGMPGGVPYIIGNELAERFSFYGMKAILVVFMTQHLLNAAGEPAYMDDKQAKFVYHAFGMLVYFFPIVGAILSDVLWGKYKTILLISLMYCVGHGMLALMDIGPHFGIWDMEPFLYAGLVLIAIGSGGIKPCVSAHVGDQFGTGNKRLLTQVFNWFYFSINLGAFASTLLTPVFLAGITVGEDPATGEAVKVGGPWLAFGVPGVLMAIATLLFWMGRNTFVHVPPAGWAKFRAETFSPEGKRAMKNLAPLFLVFVPMFWAIFDQTGSAWVLQAESMDRQVFGVTLLESQVQAVNPLFILALIPVFTYLVYPAVSRLIPFSPLRKIGVGFALTAATFGLSAVIQIWIDSKAGPVADALWAALLADPSITVDMSQPGSLSEVVRYARTLGWEQEQLTPFLAEMPNILWQILAFLLLTSAEILVSIVCLEFAYTQSPRKLKSFIMGMYFLGVSLGNFYVAGVNGFLSLTRDPETGATPLDGANYYWFFTGLMLVATVVYIFWAKSYKGQTYIQGETQAEATEARAEAEGAEPR